MKNLSTSSDDKLVQMAAAGDDRAFAEIYNRYFQRIAKYLYRYTNDREIARDLTQETFVRVFKKLDRYSPEGKFASWLYTVATNVVRNKIRRIKRPKSVMSLDPMNASHQSEHQPRIIDVVSANNKGADQALLDKEYNALFERTIASLADKYRQVILHHDIEGRSYNESAALIGCTLSAFKTRLQRARKMLSKKLQKVPLGRAYIEDLKRKSDE